LLVGRNRRKQKGYFKSARIPVSENLPENLTSKFSPESLQIQALITTGAGYATTKDNTVKLLKDGKVTFDTIFKVLEGAQKTIHLQYYIFEEGELAERLLALFIQKEAQGVEVRLIYDGIGSYSLSRSYLKKLKKAGIEPYSFLPFRLGKSISSINYRNHRKIIVVDGAIAFTGGINISDKYLKGDPALGMWHDMHLMLEGEAAWHLDTVFINDWEKVSGIRLPLPEKLSIQNRGESLVQILATGPDDHFPLMEQMYFSMITGARKHVYITNPYLIPSPAIQTALHTAALSGVDVRLLVSAQADSQLVSWCVQSYFQRFLMAGIKIYRYPEGFLHSKIITTDDCMATVGTANVDDRSFQHNYEVNAILYDSDLARRLREDFLSDSSKSELLELKSFINRPWHVKLAEGAARTISPLL
jgi:cardiolipin synthase